MEARFPQRTGGYIVAPSQPTSVAGEAKLYDYFLVSRVIYHMVESIQVQEDQGILTHIPVKLSLKGNPKDVYITTYPFIRQIGKKAPFGPRPPARPASRPPEEGEYEHMTLGQQFAAWNGPAEDRLRHLHGRAPRPQATMGVTPKVTRVRVLPPKPCLWGCTSALAKQRMAAHGKIQALQSMLKARAVGNTYQGMHGGIHEPQAPHCSGRLLAERQVGVAQVPLHIGPAMVE